MVHPPIGVFALLTCEEGLHFGRSTRWTERAVNVTARSFRVGFAVLRPLPPIPELSPIFGDGLVDQAATVTG
jgi:hypothetical protein